jgi:hypothetical protein
MTQKKNKNIEAATESLEEMLKRIGPFMPKHPQVKPEEPQEWQAGSEGTVPWPPSPDRSCGRKKSDNRSEIF